VSKRAKTALRVVYGKQERSALLQPKKGLAMNAQNVLNPNPPEFEQFLYASVGKDRRGYAVTVLSALARLGLDPWKETAELVTLGRAAAQTRLGKQLARFWDVPTLASDHLMVARDLSQLLPEGRMSGSPKRSADTVTGDRMSMSKAIWVALGIALLLLQVFLIGAGGSDE
jgi:hypothetical protein